MDQSDLDADPERQIATWIDEARAAGEPTPEAMALATASPAGHPSVRMVMLRGLGPGLVFFTDYDSDKGHDLAENPVAAAMLHWWRPEHRQVRVEGTVERVGQQESERYWATRPPGARASAAASHQSRVVASRDELEQRAAALRRQYPEDAVPRPERWGGFRITPAVVELWQEGPDRLHDRIRYRLTDHRWTLERLSP